MLLDIVNSSLSTNTVPRPWKHAMVTPIPKGKGPSIPSNTRPISILPGIMKIVERAVQQQLYHYLEYNKLLTNAQHGYRRKHSTETALTVITEHVLRAMDAGEVSILVLLDQSKCFDVVPHQQLLDKLALYGIETEWFANYLTDHTQQVQIRNSDGTLSLSKSRSNTIGVFQGGSLSCLLYTIFANDLSLHMPEGVKVLQYADDVQILVTGKKCEVTKITKLAECALQSAYDWFCTNGMKVNTSKTQALVLGLPEALRHMPPIKLNFLGTTIPDSRVVKSLGLIIDNNLSFQAHIDQMVAKCSGILIGLTHAKHVLPKTVLCTIVQSLVTSIVRYCISLYGTCNSTQLHRVQKLINFGARVISGRNKI